MDVLQRLLKKTNRNFIHSLQQTPAADLYESFLMANPSLVLGDTSLGQKRTNRPSRCYISNKRPPTNQIRQNFNRHKLNSETTKRRTPECQWVKNEIRVDNISVNCAKLKRLHVKTSRGEQRLNI